MARKKHRTRVSWWTFGLVATLCCIISNGCVEGTDHIFNETSSGTKHRGTIKTIVDPEYGDVIDCVDIYKQSAFGNPLIKELKMNPSSYPSGIKITKNDTQGQVKLFQNWHKYGKCPKGTIPIRRTRNEDTFHRKPPNPDIHEYAIVVQPPGTYYGATASISLWNPHVAQTSEFSLSQIWVASDPPDSPDNLNSVEAGWMVYPGRYEDSQTRFFIFWTNDNYHTRCYDLEECNGGAFMQVNDEICIGGPVPRISNYNGQGYSITVTIFMDNLGNWWVKVGETDIGYWPGSLFTSLHFANRISWGGEILNRRTQGLHTTTEMGSGYFPSEGYGRASYFRDLMLVDSQGDWVPPTHLLPFVSHPRCYDLQVGPSGTTFHTHFLYGGPGFSARCI